MRMMSWAALSLAAGMSSCSLMAAPTASLPAAPEITPAPGQMASAPAAAPVAIPKTAAG
jgi:hypothetical protein